MLQLGKICTTRVVMVGEHFSKGQSQSGTTLVVKDCSGCSYTSMSQKIIGKIVMCETENEDCKLGLFQDASFAGDLQDPKSNSGGLFCV